MLWRGLKKIKSNVAIVMLINRRILEYKYGEEIDYELVLLTSNDKDKLKSFDCGNVKLNHFINVFQ